VVIAGAGPAGSAAAIVLAGAGVPVTVVAPRHAGGSGMIETLPSAAGTLLGELGVLQTFRGGGHTPVERTGSAWGEPGIAWRDGFAQPAGEGWFVDRARFDASLVDEATSRGATVVRGASVVGVERRGRRACEVVVRNADGAVERIPSSFVVDATGRAAVVARALGAERGRADRLGCVFARWRGPGVGDARIVVETVEEGWWYGAVDDRGGTSVAFFSDADVLRSLRAARPPGWRRLLERTHHVAELIGTATPDELLTRAAASECRLPAAGEGWAAAGDAAATLDPLTSAGVVSALRSGADVAGVVMRTLDGDDRATAEHDRNVRLRFARYLIDRGSYYSMEGRWPESPFWRRRRAVAA
jgi:flavin-dependent dehydrogenase